MSTLGRQLYEKKYRDMGPHTHYNVHRFYLAARMAVCVVETSFASPHAPPPPPPDEAHRSEFTP